MHSIKTKLILALSVLLIFLFAVTGFLLINEKQKELARDIYTNARSFSELTSPKIIDLYRTLLVEKSFVIFNSEMKDIFTKDSDISAIRIHSFAGKVLYDSRQERDRAYEGENERLSESGLMDRIKASMSSYLLDSGRVVYLKKDADGAYMTLDRNEREIEPISDTEFIQNIIYPVEGKYLVEFSVTYENLKQRVFRMTERIVYLLIFGILMGLGFSWYFSQKITGPIEKLKEGALVLAKGDFRVRVYVKTKDEVGILAETFNKMAEDLEVSTKALVYKERVAKELEVAARIQKEIIPKRLPAIPGLDIAACLQPAVEIGGDCYDFIPTDGGEHVFYIGDVTGHGVPSGIVVSIANALIYSYSHSGALADALKHTNRVLAEKMSANMFMTILMAKYENGKMSYVSAGHPGMLHYCAKEKKVVAEKGGGIALGMVPDISKMIQEMNVDLRQGDSVVFYSDGIPEAVNKNGEQYGMQRIKRAISDHAELESAEKIKDALMTDIQRFMGQEQQRDDITLLVFKAV